MVMAHMVVKLVVGSDGTGGGLGAIEKGKLKAQ